MFEKYFKYTWKTYICKYACKNGIPWKIAWTNVIRSGYETNFICNGALVHMAHVFCMVNDDSKHKLDDKILYILKWVMNMNQDHKFSMDLHVKADFSFWSNCINQSLIISWKTLYPNMGDHVDILFVYNIFKRFNTWVEKGLKSMRLRLIHPFDIVKKLGEVPLNK